MGIGVGVAVLFGCASSGGGGQQQAAPSPTVSLENQADALGKDVDWNYITYDSKLDAGRGPRSSLFDNVDDRYWQLRALHEDDQVPTNDDQMVILHEKSLIFEHAPCDQPDNNPELYCGDANGYIYHIHLYVKSRARRAVLLAKIGSAWAGAFAKFHRQNKHCALLVVEALGLGRDGQATDDMGEPIDETRCYAHR